MTPAKIEGAQPIMISSSNCELLLGVSWRWLTRFARAHSVPMWQLGSRRFVPAAPLAAALERAAAHADPASVAGEVARLKAELAAEFRGVR